MFVYLIFIDSVPCKRDMLKSPIAFLKKKKVDLNAYLQELAVPCVPPS